ncbi:MAG TPA: transcription antitermination factor NusB [Patescibacteria group bacterium]|nr:transcription antitermination factor NusB [Patescibacteria group bacterium]
MKTSLDPRHKKRQETVKALFAESFIAQTNQDTTAKEVLANLEGIDAKIKEIAPEFPIDKINKVDLAILRLGAYELMIDGSQPEKVVIDEAIELAKEFGNDSSAPFINGALGKLVKVRKNDTTNV